MSETMYFASVALVIVLAVFGVGAIGRRFGRSAAVIAGGVGVLLVGASMTIPVCACTSKDELGPRLLTSSMRWVADTQAQLMWRTGRYAPSLDSLGAHVPAQVTLVLTALSDSSYHLAGDVVGGNAMHCEVTVTPTRSYDPATDCRAP